MLSEHKGDPFVGVIAAVAFISETPEKILFNTCASTDCTVITGVLEVSE
jgi:hypothetical protein